MKMKKNYHKMMMEKINTFKEKNIKPTLLLHVCCAPCSSAVLQSIKEYFDITIFFYNPNIQPQKEFLKRLEEEIVLLKKLNLNYKVISPEYDSKIFFEKIKGYENLGERSERCDRCFELRLEKSAKYAKENNFDFFTTTLTISPYKNADSLNQIGENLGEKYLVNFLNSDFKKNNGYKKSIELSKKYNLYRQHYCGCIFSKNEYLEKLRIRESIANN